jgi:tRNA nucleotidyltransferase (CCA-adding enzyme)
MVLIGSDAAPGWRVTQKPEPPYGKPRRVDVSHVDLAVVPQDVLGLCERIRWKGKRAWIVGGCVRDTLFGRPAADWDIATDALPKDLLSIFPRAIPTGIEHGTVTVVKDGHHYEVTTLRGEGTYSDGRRPDWVEFVDDITADLARRDFTVNAMALDPLDGKLIDPFDGRGDLRRGVLRAVGDARTRFSEDGLRVLRAARFVATLELTLDPATEQAIAPTLDTYRKVAAERVREEWLKTMRARRPSLAFDVMRRTGILAISCPELLEGVEMEQNKWHAYDVWRHGMECMDACLPGQSDPVLRIAAMLHDVGKPRSRAWSEKTQDWTFYDHDRIGAEIAVPIVERLRFSNDDRERIVALVRFHLFHYADDWTDAAVRRWVRRVGADRLGDLYRLNRADVYAKGRDFEPDLAALAALEAHVARVLAAGAALSTRDLKVNGHDLMHALGVKPGRVIGELLESLLDAVTADPSLNERERLIERARELIQEKTR